MQNKKYGNAKNIMLICYMQEKEETSAFDQIKPGPNAMVFCSVPNLIAYHCVFFFLAIARGYFCCFNCETKFKRTRLHIFK